MKKKNINKPVYSLFKLAQKRFRQRGASIIEFLVAMLAMGPLALGGIQFAMLYNAKSVINNATFEAARAGALYNAQRGDIYQSNGMRNAFARNIIPLYGGGQDGGDLLVSFGKAVADITVQDALRSGLNGGDSINIISPSQEAFNDDNLTVTIDGQVQIPNEHLLHKSHVRSDNSGLSLQDANILKIEVTYGYRLTVPVVNRLIAWAMLIGDPNPLNAAYYNMNPPRLPVVAMATVRMQSNAMPDGDGNASVPPVEVGSTASGGGQASGNGNNSGGNGNNNGGGNSGGGNTGGGNTGGGNTGGGNTGGGNTGGGNSGGGNSGGGNTGGGNTGGNTGGNNSGGSDPVPPPVTECSPEVCNTSAGEIADCSGAANSSTTTAQNAAVGNPINVVTGNKYQQEVDISPLPGNLAMQFERHYNSMRKDQLNMGVGWRHSYDVELRVHSKNSIYIDQADGRKVVFYKDKKSDMYRAHVASDGWVQKFDESYRWYWRNGHEMHFDNTGLLNFVVTPNKNTINFIRDRSGRLLQVSDPDDRAIAFQYYANDRIKGIVGPTGDLISYNYDDFGNLVSVHYPDGSQRRYHYEDKLHPNALTGITDARNIRLATYAYDAVGRAILSTHANDKGKVTLQFKNGKTLVTDEHNQTSTYFTEVRKGIALVNEIKGPGCSACKNIGNLKYFYDKNYQLTKTVSKENIKTDFVYDEHSRIVSIHRTLPNQKPQLVRSFKYTKTGLQPIIVSMPSVAAGKDHIFAMEYNKGGQLTKITEFGYRPDGTKKYVPISRSKSYAYNRNGQLIKVDGPLPGESDVTKYEYNTVGQLSAIHYPNNLTTRYKQYDKNNRPQIMIDPDGMVRRYKYNFQGQVTELNKGPFKYQFVYDPEGRPTRIVKPDSSFLEAEYDVAGRLSKITDTEGNSIVWQLNKKDNQQTVSVYDAMSNLSLQRTATFNNKAQTTSTRLPDGTSENLEYDNYGRIQAVFNQSGDKQMYRYDNLGRVNEIIDYAQDDKRARTQIDYDSENNISQITDAKNQKFENQYDDFGLLISKTDSNRKVTVFRYNEAGRMIAKSDALGEIKVYKYDVLGRLVAAGTPSHPEYVTYKYKGTRLVSLKGKYQQTHFQFNPIGQLVTKTEVLFGKSYVSRYIYDEINGKLTKKEMPDGQTLLYGYEKDSGKLVSVSRENWFTDSKLISGIDYQAFAGVKGFSLGENKKTQLQFNTSGKLTSLNSADLVDLKFDYDKAGRISQIDRNGKVENYSYTSEGYLQAANDEANSYSWGYDSSGNRRTEKASNAETQYFYEKTGNRLLGVHKTKFTPYLYDGNGQPVIVGKRRYKYNSAGQILAVYENNKLVASYEYNYRGQRILKIIKKNGKLVSTAYLYDQTRLAAEINRKGEITAQYLYIGNRPYAKLEGKKLYFIHTDHLGTPQVVTNESQKVVWQASYTPFGQAKLHTASITMNLRFPGQYFDAETGSHYNYYRYYDPATGRYITSDPIGIKGDQNNFLYANANPLQSTDILGLYSTEVHYYMTYFLARMAGMEAEEALTVALAAQFIDDNPDTQPLTVDRTVLESYHFTFDYDNTGLDGDPNTDPMQRFWKNGNLSDQQARLREAALNRNMNTYESGPKEGQLLLPCTRAQLYGEFVHAFQDSYSHRYYTSKKEFIAGGSTTQVDTQKYGKPIETYNAEGIIGHALFGHDPDQTFDVISVSEIWDETTGDSPDEWTLESVETKIYGANEAHTLAMEKELFDMFQRDFSDVYVDNGAVADDGSPILDFDPDGGANGNGGITSPTITEGVFAGQQVTWDLLANTSASTGANFGDAIAISQNEALSGRTNPSGYPYDWQGNARNMWGKIVDDNGFDLPDPNPPLDSNEIIWERKCDLTDTCQMPDPTNTTNDPRSVLQQFNQARTSEEKIDILNWFMVDAGFESIPNYSSLTGAQNRDQYLAGLDTASNYQGVILPSDPFAF